MIRREIWSVAAWMALTLGCGVIPVPAHASIRCPVDALPKADFPSGIVHFLTKQEGGTLFETATYSWGGIQYAAGSARSSQAAHEQLRSIVFLSKMYHPLSMPASARPDEGYLATFIDPNSKHKDVSIQMRVNTLLVRISVDAPVRYHATDAIALARTAVSQAHKSGGTTPLKGGAGQG